jgi:hypothetical protein
VTDYTEADIDALTGNGDGNGKLGEAPRHGSPVAEFGKFIARGYGLPDGYAVVRVVRYGGRDGTGLAVFIRAPGEGGELRIAYPRESDCSNHVKLRSRAVADTRGLTRSALITSQKTALAMYEAMCSMADHFEAADERAQTWEWVQQLRRVAQTTTGKPDSYWALRRLQDHDYSKSLVQDPPREPLRGKDGTTLRDADGRPLYGKPQRPVPVLLHDDTTGDYYVTARHMAVFLRWDLGVEGAGDDDRILTRLSEIGGERLPVQEWDKPGRDREHKVTLVLYRLPNDPPPDDEEETE